MPSQHAPCVSYFGNTDTLAFPLILIVGREYNGMGPVSHQAGRYDFTSSPRSLFWNRAYGLIDRITSEGPTLKDNCKSFRASPIIFSNVLPTAIEASVKNKWSARQKITESAIDRHIASVFQQTLIERVETVILACGPEKVFEYGSKLFRDHCEITRTPIVPLPYLGSRLRNQEFDGLVSESDAKVIRHAVECFRLARSEG